MPDDKDKTIKELQEQLEAERKDNQENRERIVDDRRERDDALEKTKQLETELADTNRVCQKQLEVLTTARTDFFGTVSTKLKGKVDDFEDVIGLIGQLVVENEELRSGNVENLSTATLLDALIKSLFKRG